MYLKIRHIYKMTIRAIVYYLAVFVLFVIRFFPYNQLVNVGGKLGVLYFKISKDRKNVIENLKIAFPEKTNKEIYELLYNFSVHLGKSLFELFRLNTLDDKKFFDMFDINGKEHLTKAFENGKGVILIAGHLGNWELLGAYLSSIGYPINVVAKKLYEPRLNNLLIKMRQARGVKSLLRTESTKDMINVLKNNECLGVLIDQDTNVKGCFVNFFGRECFTPIGATVLALKYNPIVLSASISRIENNRHLVEISDPINLEELSDKDLTIQWNTQKFSNTIEKNIRKNPSQWVWMHKRWKTKEAK